MMSRKLIFLISICLMMQASDLLADRLAQIKIAKSVLTNGDAGRCEKAIRTYDRIAPSNPTADLFFSEFSECFVRRGDWLRALEYSEQTLEHLTKAPKGKANHNLDLAKLRHAYLLAQLKQQQKLDKFLKAIPKTYRFDYLTSKYSAERSLLPNVIERYITIALAQPLNSDLHQDVYLWLIKNALLSDQATKILLGGRKNPQEKWVEDDFVLALAKAYQAQKKYSEALAYYQGYYKKTKDWQVLSRIAQLYKLQRNEKKEKEYLELRVKNARNSLQRHDSLVSLGRYYWNKGHDKQAEVRFRQAVKIAGRSLHQIHSRYLYGRLLESDGRVDRATAVMKPALYLKGAPEELRRKQLKILMRIAWLEYKRTHYAKAVAWYDKLLSVDSGEVYADEALFWKAVCLQKLNKSKEAQLALMRLVESYPLAFYGLIGRKRLLDMDVVLPNLRLTETDKVQAKISFSQDIQRHLDRYQWLVDIERPLWAKQELAQIDWSGLPSEQLLSLAKIFQSIGDYNSAFKVAKYGVDYDGRNAPIEWRQQLYPRPYQDKIVKYATSNGNDPFLLWAIMRQESWFQSDAVSIADAIGLMQLLPSLARQLIPYLGNELQDPQELFHPELNVRLASLHLSDLRIRYRQRLLYVVAAYNGSERAVNNWRKRFADKNLIEFVEEIPYGETKKYVKRVLGNYAAYQLLYQGWTDYNQLP